MNNSREKQPEECRRNDLGDILPRSQEMEPEAN
jgi:hypothetical protein